MPPLRQRPAIAVGGTLLAITCLFWLGSSPSSTAYMPDFKFPTSKPPSQPPPAAHPLSGASSTTSYSKLYGSEYHGASSPADINRVTNSTLGFGRIFVVGLPERSDKRDALTLASALTGFGVEWIPGVTGTSIPDKAVPYGVNREKLMETNLGSWRGHMNAIRKMVEEGIETALIMEDDMDWDVRLKPLLEVVASGVRTVSAGLPDVLFPGGRPEKKESGPRSPYGDDWDLLWLGHCGEPFPEMLAENKALPEDDPAKQAMSRKFTVINDATVPPSDKVSGFVNFTAYPEHTRWVHVTAAPICTFAYALSQRGARKVLFDLSVDRLSGPFDNALAGLCRRAVGSWGKILKAGGGKILGDGEHMGTDNGDRGLDMKCFSVTPSAFFHHKPRGPVSGDSDIQVVGEDGSLKHGGEDGKVREKGTTENIVWSARLNVRNMLLGLDMESQF